ncbi:hypothetical protein KB206_01955 [Microvirga sp. STS02]|uniref:hypothetical protein n=1 Tax=Hymenobacter negativus TaxID=2795026 RepID=UPI0018DBD457|nr:MULTISPECIES: hypothetical protein [Bacteria]MBH8567629.1 hypothetical protein [Hymenobacter negativus]MBR7207363.1 hypothetical protein [Microvirga sp. STS02]
MFQKIIDDTYVKEKENTEKVKFIIEALKEMKRIVSLMPKETSKVVTQFSDSIVVSFKEDDTKEIPNFIGNINRVIVGLFSKGILCRGAISYGKLFHNHEFVLGPALVEAYQTETEAAIYPRVILDRSVLEVMKANYTINGAHSFRGIRFDSTINSYFRRDSDDKYFIDYFSSAAMYLRDDGLVDYYTNMRNVISNGLRFKSAGLKAKYGWMKNKYNKIAEDFDALNIDDEIPTRYDIHKLIKTLKRI